MPATDPLRVLADTPAWVDARRDVIGSSDLPIITGSSPYRTSRLDLWAIKTRLLEPQPPDEELQELWDLGHAIEPVIAERYARHPQGRPVRRHRIMARHAATPWAAATLDRVSAVKGERRIVELKWAPHRRWLDGPEPVPADVQDQVQWQMLVTGILVADVAVLNGSHLEVHELHADRGYQADLFALAAAFRRLVEEQRPPAIDGSEQTTKTLARLHPSASLAALEPTLELSALAYTIRDATRAAAAADAERDRLRNVMRGVLGDASGVESDDYRVSWLNNRPTTTIHWDEAYAELGALLDLARSQPGRLDPDYLPDPVAIRDAHTETKPGPRVLRAYFKNEETGRWS